MNLIQNYFFVPASKPRFIEKSRELKGIDHRIFDFEDSISSTDIDNAIYNVSQQPVNSTDWVRIPLGNQFQEISRELFKIGYRNVIIPKVKSKEEFGDVLSQLQSSNKKTKAIILVENALIYLQLEEILKKWKKYITGIGLGSHDFTAVTRIQHQAEILMPLRLKISLLANAYGVIPIDVASMNISDRIEYHAEIQSAFDLGYRAKFILHPFQLQLMNEYPFFSEEEVEDASDVLKYFLKGEEKKEVVIKYKGKIYERPHIENLKAIKAWGEKYYGADR